MKKEMGLLLIACYVSETNHVDLQPGLNLKGHCHPHAASVSLTQYSLFAFPPIFPKTLPKIAFICQERCEG